MFRNNVLKVAVAVMLTMLLVMPMVSGVDVNWESNRETPRSGVVRHDIGENTGIVSFRCTMKINVDGGGILGFADSAFMASEWAGFGATPVAVRAVNNSSTTVKNSFDAYNGSANYSQDAVVTYSAGDIFDVRVEINVDARTFSVWVAPSGSPEIQIAHDYAFRSGSATGITKIDSLYVINTGSSADNRITVTSYSLSVEATAFSYEDNTGNPLVSSAPLTAGQEVVVKCVPESGTPEATGKMLVAVFDGTTLIDLVLAELTDSAYTANLTIGKDNATLEVFIIDDLINFNPRYAVQKFPK